MKLKLHFGFAPVATLFAFLATAPGLRADPYPQTVLNAGPAAYWRFETINDTSLSNGYVNAFQGNATVTAPGQGVPLSGVANNRALLLDGDGDSVRTGVTNQLTFASSGTFMAWVNFNQLPSTGNRTVELIVKSHFSSPLDWVMDPNNRLFGYAGDYTTVFYDFNPALATNTWYHLAFTFDSVGGFKRLYVNGVLVGDLPLSPNLTGSPDEIVIGNSPVFTDRSLDGRMDEVALFNRALTSAEIQTMFTSAGVTTPAPQPVVRVSIELPREINALERGMNEYFGLGLNFTIIPAPFNSTNALYSTHSNHSSIIGGPSGGGFSGGGYLYGTLAEAVQEATNGLWTLVLNQGTTSQQIYRFALSVTNLSTNDYAVLNVTSPVDGSVGNLPDVPFTWTQSMPWLINNLELDGPTYARATVPPGSTSWTNPPTLNLGRHDFNLYLRTNAARWIGITTPTNGTGQSPPNWEGGTQLTARRGIRFRVGYFIPPPPGLHAHLRFDDENYLGLDTSGSNNYAYVSYYDQPPTYNANGKLDGAASFTQGGWLEFQDAFTPTLGGDFTVAVWVQTTQTAGNDSDPGIDGAGIVGGYVNYNAKNTIPIALNGSKAGFMTGNENGEQTLHSTVNINNSAPNWVHVAVTRVQATGEKRLYINGVLDASETGNTNLLDELERVRVGYGNNITYNGLLDDLQIYSASLPASDIAYLYANSGEEITNFASLGAAVEAPELPWTTGGNADWFPQVSDTHDNVDAAGSGAIGDDQESWIETTVSGPGSLSFWWNVSCEDGFDYLEFLIDGNWQADITGESGWEQQTYPIDPGSHTLRWRYYKNGSTGNGLDAGFLDELSFVTPPPNTNTPPLITVNPFSQTNRPGYQVALLAAATSNVAITWEWYKLGNAAPIANATNALYIPANAGTTGVAGDYFSIATNPFGSATTTVATVTFQNAALPPDWSGAFRSAFNNNPADTNADINLASLFDANGNIYTVGSVTGTNVFGTNTLISVNGKESSSFLKQTATGTPIWGRSMTNDGNGSSYPRGLAPAPGDGFYVLGLFVGTNWLGTNQLVDTAKGATYLARFDANGNNLWLRTFVGTNANFPTHHTLVSDPVGNVTLSALISGYTSLGATNLFAEGQRGILAQYDPSGNLRWVQFPSAWPSYLTYSGGRIYGSMGGGLTNYIGGVTNVSDRRQALFALDATTGQGLWVQGLATKKDQGNPSGFGSETALVAVSGTNVFVTGTSYGSNAVFGPFSVTFPAGTGQYFARYDMSGNAQLATSFGSQYTWPWATLADASGNVYVGADFDTYSIFGSNLIAAPFYETVQFVGTIENRIPGQACLAKFDRNGNPLWARPAESEFSYLNLRDLTLAPDGVWACGFFNQVGKFGTNTLYGGLPPYHRSGYLAKITSGTALALPVTLLNPKYPGSNFQFSFVSQAGFTHTVLYRTNLAIGSWQTNSSVAGDGTLKTINVPLTVFGGAKQGFVRVATQ